MNLSRRNFLSGVLALGAASVIRPNLAPAIPSIVGNGIHDDTLGLNALFSGKPVNLSDDLAHVLTADRIELTGGLFLVSAPIIVKTPHTLIRNAGFKWIDTCLNPVIRFDESAYSCTLDGAMLRCREAEAFPCSLSIRMQAPN